MVTVFTDLPQFQDVVDLIEEHFPESDVLDTERGRYWYMEWECDDCGGTHGKYTLGFPSRRKSIGMRLMATATVEPEIIRDAPEMICQTMKEKLEAVTHKALIDRSAPWN
jgi:hypothetical protein